MTPNKLHWRHFEKKSQKTTVSWELGNCVIRGDNGNFKINSEVKLNNVKTINIAAERDNVWKQVFH